MWLQLFTVVLGIALGLGVGAVILESAQKEPRRYARRRIARAR
jgi:hypothetical protein